MSRLILGRTPGGVDVTIDPTEAAHTLFTGQTRSGKSVQVYGALAQLPRAGVQVCGIDPTGILFNALGDQLGGDALRVLTLSDPEQVEHVMLELVAEMDRRIRALLAKRLDKFTDFTTELPLLIVLMEEYPGTLAALQAIDAASGARPVDRLETKVRAAIQRLALEGAKVGVRLWLVAQRADASLLTGVLRSQLTQRFSFRQDPDGLRMLHETITPEQIDRAQSFPVGRAYAEIASNPAPVEYQADYISYQMLTSRFAQAQTAEALP